MKKKICKLKIKEILNTCITIKTSKKCELISIWFRLSIRINYNETTNIKWNIVMSKLVTPPRKNSKNGWKHIIIRLAFSLFRKKNHCSSWPVVGCILNWKYSPDWCNNALKVEKLCNKNCWISKRFSFLKKLYKKFFWHPTYLFLSTTLSGI